MKSLYTLLVILTVGIASAQQQSVLTISQIAHGDNTYTHIKGDDHLAENCFAEGSVTGSITLGISVDGLSVENLYMNNVPYSWVGTDGEAVVSRFAILDDYNEIYRNRLNNTPIIDRTTDLLRCDGWAIDPQDNNGLWYVNSDFPGYAYNPIVATSGTNPHVPQLVRNYVPGSQPNLIAIADGGDRIYVGSFTTNEAAVAAVEAAIRLDMNPITTPEEEEEMAVDAWIQAGVQGWSAPGGYDLAWSNAIYPGFAHSVDEWTTDRQYAEYNPHLIGFNAYVGAVNSEETSGWRTRHVGTFQTEQEAINAGRQYIIDNYGTVDAQSLSDLLITGILTKLQNDGRLFIPDNDCSCFSLSNFDTTTHANPGWLRGVYEGGLAGYTVTAPDHLRNTITATWTWTDSDAHTHTGNDTFVVPSTTVYIHGSSGRTYADEAAIIADTENFGSTGQDRINRGHFTINHIYADGAILIAQQAARDWAISAINDFID